jgi:DNA-directed RNA polymerase specialized sigma24 family protein
MPSGPDAFPPTRQSLLEAVRGGDAPSRAAALEALSRAYWQPACTYLAWRWRLDIDTAQDLVQEFFARALERDLFARYEPSRARFRTYLRLCLDSFAANERKAAARLKRGGGAPMLSLEEASVLDESALQAADEAADAMFQREWTRAVFGRAVDRLRLRCEERGKRVAFAVFQRYDLEGPTLQTPPSYAALAEEYDVPVTQVTNFLAWCRREFRSLVLEVLREQCASDEEFRADAWELLGVRVP